ncbi:MAG: GNAT family N-acetyltransferase [Rhodobacter sp.]|nr:GNAT family N-acetyltransferase [Rhodobacter sp.]
MTGPVPYPHEAPPTGASAALAADLRAQLPRLETPRCILRAPEITDFATYREIVMSDRAQFMVDEPLDREDAWLDFAQCVAGWLLRGHGLWTIRSRAGNKVLGFVLICMEFGDREPELGWFVTAEAEGQGYAFEAALAARDHGLAALSLPSLVSYVDPGNARSIRLAKRLGARRDDDAARAFDEPLLVYRHAPVTVLQ